MFNNSSWLYTAFFCQQAIEKLVKGLFIIFNNNDNIPYLHNIGIILQRFEDKLPVKVPENIYDFLSELSTFYIKARYTDYKQKMSKLLNKDKAETILSKTKEVFAWLLNLKK
jgi:HEPN domain-containing protein